MHKTLQGVIKNDFLNFLKNPKENFTDKFKKDFTIFIFLIILSFFVSFLKSLITNEGFIDEGDLNKYNFLKIFPFIFLIPLIEELAFRGFLKFKNRTMFFFSIISILIFITTFIKNEIFQFASISIIIILTVVLYFHKKKYVKLLNYITKNLKILIWISSIIFGLIHLTNFHNFEYINLLGITQKIIAGLFFCYITRKYNIFYSYFFHALNNSIPFLIIIVHKLLH
jgi:membrane protease YdiL (CAAX protease family)